ncbi:MAG: hypothetical protein HMLKMBBP_03090 [Planctomycetes bacterium]|nr:hypothetical protein [Planctomycetota bacterium]
MKEFCSNRVSGTFPRRFTVRTADAETGDDFVFAMIRGRFSVYAGD